MRIYKSQIVFLGIILYSIFLYFLPWIDPDSILNSNNGLINITINLVIYIGLFFMVLLLRLQERTLNSKEITFIAIYSAFTSLARIPFVVIPGFQPCTYLIFCAGYVFGPLIGFLIGANTAWISNIFLGQGPWTIYQIFGWGLIGIVGSIMKRFFRQSPNKLTLAIIGFILGFIYGWLLNFSWLVFFPPITWEKLILFNLNSLFFDFSHALANFLFLFYFGSRTIIILERYKTRFHFQMVEIKNSNTIIKVEEE